jgi:hypothetical protein
MSNVRRQYHSLMETLFKLAGLSMLAHLLLSQLLRLLVKWNSELAMELFAVPNAPLMPDVGLRLLRVRYFLFWQAEPDAMREESTLARLAFFTARITGFAFPAFMLAFFTSAFYDASQ